MVDFRRSFGIFAIYGKRMKAHIQIVGWNHRGYLENVLKSCLEQTVPVEIIYVDNASEDGSVEFVRTNFPGVKIIENKTNRGYAGGHNDALKATQTEIAILMNPDISLKKDFVEKIVNSFLNPKVGAVTPLLLRPPEGNGEILIDSFGLKLNLSLRGVNKYEGKKLKDFPYKSETELWGFTGAAAALRREAINDTTENGEFFDETLHSYREDVDASWRLQKKGWKILGIPQIKVFHVRAARKTARNGVKKSTKIIGLSWRNYFLVILKNAAPSQLILHFPFLLVETLARLAQLIFKPYLWGSFEELIKLAPEFIRKRKSSNIKSNAN